MENHNKKRKFLLLDIKKGRRIGAPWAVYLRFTLLIYNYDGNNIF